MYYVHIVSLKAIASIYQLFVCTVRAFCLETDDMYIIHGEVLSEINN